MTIINVSTAIKTKVEGIAKDVCVQFKAAPDSFTQDFCAITAWKCLKELGVIDDSDMDKATKENALQVLKKCGNASALRQAIMAVEEKTKPGSVAATYLDAI